MSDVLTITVPIGPRYPSVNHQGADGYRGGRKSEDYKRLFEDVVTAARAEIDRTGWSTAVSDCALTVIRYIPDRRRVDASNLAKTECDALTKAGVWTDDRLASPCTLVVRYDPAGEHRLSIVVVKLHQSSVPDTGGATGAQPNPRRRATTSRRAEVGTSTAAMLELNKWRAGDPIPAGYADYNGKLVTREFALEKLGKGAK